MNDNLEQVYFEWMCSHVCDNHHPLSKYSDLLSFLHSVEFKYVLSRDVNRYEDGISLRFRFAYDRDIPYSRAAVADENPCTVLEMLVALCMRCEETIMSNSELGDRTSVWFWDCIKSLGLERMSNVRFNRSEADRIVNDFMERRFERDGRGSIVTVHNPRLDVREMEIWPQMMTHLSEEEGY